MNWVTFAPGNMCMENEVSYFSSNWMKNEIILRKDYKNGMVFEFKTFPEQGYAISHAGLTIWFRYYTNRVDVYEFLIRSRPVPSWEEFVGFLKEC